MRSYYTESAAHIVYKNQMTAGRAPLWTAAALGALSLAVAAFVRVYAAPAPWHYFAYDQQVYLAIARAPFSTDPQVHHASGSWRLLPPLAARYIGMPIGGAERGFLVLTFTTFALLPAACLAWLTSLGVSRTSAIACAAVMAIAPAVVGLLAWDVVRVDSVGLLLLFLAVTAVVRGRGSSLCLAIAAMAFTKETALLGAFFAAAWAVCVDRRLLPAAAVSVILAVAIRSFLQWWIPPSPEYPFHNLKDFHVVMSSMSASYAGRRLLLTTAGTWNLMLPLMAVAMASRRWSGRELALAGALVVTMIQLLFATDNERVVAAGYPFVLAWCALQLDTIDEPRRRWAGAAIVLAQVPWLLAMGRVWPAPLPEDQLPHMPPIRYVEIAIVIASAAAAAIAFVRGPRPGTRGA
jgi:hypothetical protein